MNNYEYTNNYKFVIVNELPSVYAINVRISKLTLEEGILNE